MVQAEQVRQAEAAAAASSERRRQLELRTAQRAARLQRRCAVALTPAQQQTRKCQLPKWKAPCRRLLIP